MWDAKRQTIWLATAVIIATVVVYTEARDEHGVFDTSYFIQLEVVFLAIIGLMFYIYSRRKS
jgi:hypothetical protein